SANEYPLSNAAQIPSDTSKMTMSGTVSNAGSRSRSTSSAASRGDTGTGGAVTGAHPARASAPAASTTLNFFLVSTDPAPFISVVRLRPEPVHGVHREPV